MSFDIGDVVTLDFTDSVNGVPTDPTALTLTITLPDGTTAPVTPSHDGVGVYSATYVPTMNGLHTYLWQATGTGQSTETGQFWVGTGVSIDDVKAAAKKTLTLDDAQLTRMLDAAFAEYVEYVGPMPGVVTETLSGGGSSLLLRSPRATVTAAAYSDGTTITVGDLAVENGIVYFADSTFFTRGIRNVTVTYTAAALPANHREAIIADVAGYFELTQEGPSGPDDGYSLAQRGAPLVLFPRIRALAVPSVA